MSRFAASRWLKSPHAISRPGPILWLLASAVVFIGFFRIVLHPYYYQFDDGFITHNFAKNLAAGHGIVFHPGFPPIQGSSSFLHTLLLALLSKVTSLPVHVLGSFFSVASYLGLVAGILALAVRNARDMDRSTWCLLLFAGLSFQLPLLLSYGLETTFVTLLLVWSLYFILTRNSNLAMLSIALLPLTRLDYCFFFPTLFLVAYLENRHFRASFALFVPALGLVLAYLSFARLYFGEMFPYSWIAKTYFPESVSGVLSWSVFFRARPASLWLIGGGAAAISAFAIANRRVPASIAHDEPNITFVGIVALLITGFAYIAVLQFQRAPDMPWYFVTFFCLLFLGLLYAIAHTQRRLLRTLLLVGLIALNLVLDLQTSKSFASKAGNQDRREKIGLYLRDNVPDITQKSILLYEVGKIPYYSGARTYDTLALVSREGIDGLKQNDASTLFLATLPDFVAGPNMPNYFPMSFLHNKAFTDNYARVIQVDDYVLWRKVTPRRDSDSK